MATIYKDGVIQSSCTVKELMEKLEEFKDEDKVEVATSGGAGGMWINEEMIMEEF